MIDETDEHWEGLYQRRDPTGVSWYEATPSRSLEYILQALPDRDSPLVDAGGGASNLAEHLLGAGYADVTVVDVSATALEAARRRIGAAAASVDWIVADVLTWQPSRRYGLWHDRALFHFLLDESSRARYRHVLKQALEPSGHLVLATFGPEGPSRCSGLEVQRYRAEDLSRTLGPEYRLLRSDYEQHVTPGGIPQQFLYSLWVLGDDCGALRATP
jgi:SAM-dependent methyltransferase